MQESFLWFDLETFGRDPKRSRIAQFAAIRTDSDLRVIGDPVVRYCQPARDLLPSPEATLITGITPQMALAEGLCERDFCAELNGLLSEPGTCAVGYNSLRFDDEFIRHTLFRNFHDPYEREWRHGNSRWDLLDLSRLLYALRPEGMNWPIREAGLPSFKLEHLAAANGITHARAHDALSDVEALIDLARTMRKAQPKLFDYYLGFRRKARTQSLLNIAEHTPVLHVSGRFSAANGCAAIVAPLCIHPDIPNRVIVLDLLPDPSALANMSADDIRDRLYTPLADLPEGESRVALKEVHLNRCPALVELKHVSDSELQRLGLDRQVALGNVQKIRQMSGLIPRVREVFHRPVSDGPAFTTTPRDPDQSLYDGFISDADKQQCLAIRHQRLQTLINMAPEFRDPRLLALWPRYLARNAPDYLSPTQRDAWTAYRRQRLTTDSGLSEYSIQSYFDSITELRRQHVADSEPHRLLDALEAWGRELQREID
ncbi:MAG TPA: exodeoxyribonuclease I [Aquimonas sp.]|nr:exodeoxyribonuclease I [Aquimonas sp.]HRF53120.1 exodeoxyribonuclease I [Aquimonas sp.]